MSHAETAAQLGRALADRGMGLIYGGSSVGLMGVVANAVLENGGSVTGVIPGFLADREAAHRGLTELRIVRSLEERKAVMLDLADAFIVLPGGYGTLDEAFEVLCQAQLDRHTKPCIFLSTGPFFRHLVAFLDHATSQGFISIAQRAMIIEAGSVAEAMNNFPPLQSIYRR